MNKLGKILLFLLKSLCPTFCLAIISLLLFCTILVAKANLGFAQGPPSWVSDELLVGLRPGVSRAKAKGIYQSLNAAFIGEIAQINVHLIHVPSDALEAVEQALSHRPEVEFVEKNFILSPVLVPNDPYYPNGWHLPKISAPQAWDISQGESEVVIAILDSGVDSTHPDLTSKLVPGYNFYNNNTDTSDVYGHGTKVAGAAAAIGNNGIGVASVAWQNLIMPVRVTDTQGYGYVSIIADGLTWAVDNGAKVMNLSFAGIAGSSTIKSAAQYVVNHGGLVVAAAGNCACLDATAENPYIISVSATDQNDNLATFSSRGDYVDVSAPGVGIYTTVRGGTYGSGSGTSYASPITAGVAALIMSANPNLTPDEVESILEMNGDDLGTGGYDSSFGFGRVNAYKAILAAVGTEPTPDATAPVVTITSPTNGSTLSKVVKIKVSANDDVWIQQVEVYADGSGIGSASCEASSCSPIFNWNTRGVSNGMHTLTAYAYDAAGNMGTSSPVTVYK